MKRVHAATTHEPSAFLGIAYLCPVQMASLDRLESRFVRNVSFVRETYAHEI